MTSMVKRVADAIQDVASISESGGLNYEEMARAAIEAMREPTERMEDAGNLPTYQWVDDTAGNVWTRMIDSALEGRQ